MDHAAAPVPPRRFARPCPRRTAVAVVFESVSLSMAEAQRGPAVLAVYVDILDWRVQRAVLAATKENSWRPAFAQECTLSKTRAQSSSRILAGPSLLDLMRNRHTATKDFRVILRVVRDSEAFLAAARRRSGRHGCSANWQTQSADCCFLSANISSVFNLIIPPYHTLYTSCTIEPLWPLSWTRRAHTSIDSRERYAHASSRRGTTLL
jgi:hypothetical protein